MKAKWGIPQEDLDKIVERDEKCVYCHKAMIYPYDKNNRKDSAEIEHFNHRYYWDCVASYVNAGKCVCSIIAICCGECNRSRNNLPLLEWFKRGYCLERKINYSSVTRVVQKYIDEYEKDKNKKIGEWVRAKTYESIAPHEYIVKEKQPQVYLWYKRHIINKGKDESFTLHGSTNIYRYYYEGDYKYWIIDNILNRAKNNN
jgi:hypothetical protein